MELRRGILGNLISKTHLRYKVLFAIRLKKRSDVFVTYSTQKVWQSLTIVAPTFVVGCKKTPRTYLFACNINTVQDGILILTTFWKKVFYLFFLKILLYIITCFQHLYWTRIYVILILYRPYYPDHSQIAEQ